jgi:transcriptional regulator with XRE-family HTH domain
MAGFGNLCSCRSRPNLPPFGGCNRAVAFHYSPLNPVARRLPNYIRSARKRTGLSQEDLAFLLGRKCGTMVSRYERFRREPTLSTVFALEAVLGKPARELFAGVYERAEGRASERAAELLDRLSTRASNVRISRKVTVLSRLAIQAKNAGKRHVRRI